LELAAETPLVLRSRCACHALALDRLRDQPSFPAHRFRGRHVRDQRAVCDPRWFAGSADGNPT